nr:immunoglobulin light chain junction region [Macaca mulatta]MOV86523.1 immunoglobulin light chain junction region [Macaca mulatta]
CFQDIQLPLTF